MYKENLAKKYILRFIICALILMVSLSERATAYTFHCLEGCTTYDCCGCGVPEECDNCTGYGWITWTHEYTGEWYLEGSATDCDDIYNCEYAELGFVLEDNATEDASVEFSTYGSEYNASCECVDGDTECSCTYEYTVHNEWDAEPLTNWTDDVQILVCKCSPIQMQNQGDKITYTAGNSTTTTTGWDFSFTTGIKAEVVELAASSTYSYSESQTKSFLGSTEHTVSASDVGKHIGGFASQWIRKKQIRLHHWGCDGEISGDRETEWVRKVDPASPDYRIGNSPSDVWSKEKNTGLMTDNGSLSES